MKSDIYRRFAFIEARLLYGGGITAREFGDMFGLSRQAAQNIIARYAAHHPGNMVRDLSLRRQVAGEEFHPEYIRANVQYFLDHLRGQTLSGFFFQDVEWNEEIVVDDVTAGIRPKINIDAAHNLLLGLFNKYPLYAGYRSKKRYSERILSPHAMIFARNRYLVRCYCHLKEQYLDFSLSRFRHTEPATVEEWISGEDDKNWHTYTELSYVPNPKLPLRTQLVVREDYMLDDQETLVIPCRVAMVYYIKKEMGSEMVMNLAKWICVK